MLNVDMNRRSLLAALVAGTGAAGIGIARSTSSQSSGATDGGVSFSISPPEGGTDADRIIAEALATLRARGGGELIFRPGLYPVSGMIDGRDLSSVRLSGSGATVKARDGTSFEYLLHLGRTSAVTIDGFDFDCNKDGRRRSARRLMAVNADGSRAFRAERCTFRNTLGLMVDGVPRSAAALAVSDNALRPVVSRCRFLDLGVDANSRPSDGVFMRATEGVIVDCFGENVTDHVAVLEGCQRSVIRSLKVKNVTSAAAISNDGDADCAGNLIDGVSGTSDHLGSFGGIVGVYAGLAGGRGKIRDCVVRNVDVSAAANATGQGPGLFLYGLLDGVVVSNVRTDAGVTKERMNHACLIDDVIDVEITNSIFRADGIGTGVRILNGSKNVVLDGNRYENCAIGIAASQGSRFVERGSTFVRAASRFLVADTARRLTS